MRLLAETLRHWTRLPERASCLAVTIPARVMFFALELAVVSASVQVGLALPMVVYFHRVGLTGVSANTIVVPLMCAVIPVGFIGIFTGWGWAAKAAGGLLAVSHAVVDWHARLEPQWRIPTPPLWLGIAICTALILAALALPARRRWFTAATAALAVLLTLLVWHPFPPQIARNQFEMTVVDVGQGDSILLAFPDGQLMLVDGGGIPSFGGHPAQLDIGEDVVSPYLWERGIRHIDVMACTHGHADHIGGLPALMDNFHPRQLWTGANSDNPAWCALREKARQDGVRIVPLYQGQCFHYGGADLEVLAPARDYVPRTEPRNDDSLAFRVTFGERSFLLTGDIEKPVEDQLVANGLVRKTDVLKVAHHGSKTSSTPEFVDIARPAYAVMSVGFENSYGHPSADVVERFEQLRSCVLRTDLDGFVTVTTSGRRLHMNMARWSGALGSSAGGLLPREF